MTTIAGWYAALVVAGAPAGPPADAGAFAEALWLVQRVGSAEAAAPANDRRTKARLAAVLSGGGITWPSAEELIDESDFTRLAGGDDVLDREEIRRALEALEPRSRAALLPEVRGHLDLLSTSLDSISDEHQPAIEALAGWIAANHRVGEALHVVAVCTGNTRRSMLCSALGNAGADYVGLPEVRFHSGGTEASAMNPRTIAALEEVGFQIEPTGELASSGAKGDPNPHQRVVWGEGREAVEFSKLYGDPANPGDGFAALMVCSEADGECPVVRGAGVRISMPFLDPKAYDGSRFESAKYGERRDDIGRVVLAALGLARFRIDHAGGERPSLFE